jgi:molecular chaperone DnaK (HSP70)
MQAVDMNVKVKADAKNAVEEYVYSMREKLSEQFSEFVTDEVCFNLLYPIKLLLQENDHFRTLLTDTEDWLYGEGEDAESEVYEKKLAELREIIEPPIHKRQREKFDQEQIAQNLAAEEAARAEAEANVQPQSPQKAG